MGSGLCGAKSIKDDLHHHQGFRTAEAETLADVADVAAEEQETARKLAEKGFTIRQLLLFYSSHLHQLKQETTTSDVVREIVLPETQEQQCSYMESEFMRQHGGSRLAKKLVSHAWASPFRNTVLNILLDACGSMQLLEEACISKTPQGDLLDPAMALRSLSEDVLGSTYWLCIFAVNQHRSICGDCPRCRTKARPGAWGSEAFAAESCKVCSRPKATPCPCGSSKWKQGDPRYEIDKLREVARHVDAVVVSLDPRLIALSRVWVVQEIGLALTGKPVVFRLAEGLGHEEVQKLCQGDAVVTRVEKCSASCPADRERIVAEIKKESGGCAAFDDFVACMVELNMGRCSRLAQTSKSHATILLNLKHLEMKLQWSSKFLTNLSALGFGWGVLECLTCLETLAMDFTDCQLITDLKPLCVDLAVLTRLRELRLDFTGCKRLADLTPLGAALRELKGLRKLGMRLSECGVESLSGLEHLGGAQQLQELDLQFLLCDVLADVSQLGVGLGSLKELRKLAVTIHMCDPREVNGLEAWRGMAALQELSLDFKLCEKLKHMTPLADGLRDLQDMRALSVNFFGCRALETAQGLEGLAGMTQLRELSLDFEKCQELRDIAQLGSGMSCLDQLLKLELNFKSCIKLQSLALLGAGMRGLKCLQTLGMNFEDCKALTCLSGLECLACATELHELSLNFKFCELLADITPLGDGLRSLSDLKTLAMNFQGCVAVQQIDGFECIGNMQKLQTLSLNFRRCRELASIAPLGFGLCSLKELQTLKVNCEGCEALTSIDCLRCLDRMMVLRTLHLNFEACRDLKDLVPLGEAMWRLKLKRQLELNFEVCTSFAEAAPPRTSRTSTPRSLAGTPSRRSQAGTPTLCGTPRCRTPVRRGFSRTNTPLGLPFDARLERPAWPGLPGLRTSKDKHTMALSFYFCRNLMQGRGFEEFGGLQGLRQLEVEFFECKELITVASMGESMVKLKDLQKLTMSFEGCGSLPGVQDLASLASMQQMQTLSLNFKCCVALMDVIPLAAAVQKLHKLKAFTLNCAGCTALAKVEGLECVGDLPELGDLHLNFEGCERLKDPAPLVEGVRRLKASGRPGLELSVCVPLKDQMPTLLPGQSVATKARRMSAPGPVPGSRVQGLRQARSEIRTDSRAELPCVKLIKGRRGLTLTFRSCRDLASCREFMDLGPVKELQELDVKFVDCGALANMTPLGGGLRDLQDLEALTLSLDGCEALADVGWLECLGKMKKLQELRLNFSGCAELADVALLGRSIGGLKELQMLSMDFADCEALTHVKGLECLGSAKELRELSLSFTNCRRLKDVTPLRDGLRSLKQLLELNFNFHGCEQLSDLKRLCVTSQIMLDGRRVRLAANGRAGTSPLASSRARRRTNPMPATELQRSGSLKVSEPS